MMSCDVAADAKEKELPDVVATPHTMAPSSSSHAASSAMGLTASAAGGRIGGGGANACPNALQGQVRNSSGSKLPS
jgi:hypothetical protein